MTQHLNTFLPNIPNVVKMSILYTVCLASRLCTSRIAAVVYFYFRNNLIDSAASSSIAQIHEVIYCTICETKLPTQK